MPRCPWTSAEFPATRRGANEKKFASPEARAQAHLAARLFTEDLIARGFLTWGTVRHWYENREIAPPQSYTTKPVGSEAPADAGQGAPAE